MTTHEQYGLGESTVHDAVGAYVSAFCDDADATAFEAHLAGCQQLRRPPGGVRRAGADAGHARPGILDAAEPSASTHGRLPALPAPAARRWPRLRCPPRPPPPSGCPPRPGPRTAQPAAARPAGRRGRGQACQAQAPGHVPGRGRRRADHRRTDGRRGGHRRDGGRQAATHDSSPAEDVFFAPHDGARSARRTRPPRSAPPSAWSRRPGAPHTVLELKNVKGPLKCSLIAVSKTGEQEVVTSWSVPTWGYGIPGSPNESPRSRSTSTAVRPWSRNDIDHFEVRTFDGKRLVEVDA